MNTRYLKIEALTPLHIGSGRMLQGNTEYLYFEDDRAVAVVDERKILDIIGEENIGRWVDIIGRGDDLLAYLRQRKKDVLADQTAKRKLSVAPGSDTPQLWQQQGETRFPTLREQIFSGNGEPILPGSSLKGAIRTAVFNQAIQSNPYPARQINDFKTTDFKGKPKYNGSRLERTYFGPDPNHDVFRLLRIGDAHFEQTVCLLAETLNEKGGNSFEMKESVKQFIECIPAGAETLCRVQIPEELKDRLNEPRFRAVASKMPQRDRMEWPRLFADINANTERLVKNEIARYAPLDLPKGATFYVEELEKMLGKLADNECIIRVGFGTGYLNMTGGWPEEQWSNVVGIDYQKEMADLAEGVRRTGRYNSFALPKSRKMTMGGVPLGFLKLTVFSESEFADWQAKSVERQATKAQKVETSRALAEQQAAEVETKRLEEEAEAQQLAEEAKKPKLHPGPITKNMEVDAEVVVSGKPNKVKIYVSGFEDRQIEMVESAIQPKGYICRVALVVEKGKLQRARHLRPK